MSNTKEIDLNNVCRTCLTSENLKLLSDEYSTQAYFDNMLITCTSIERSKNGLPIQICSNCITELNRSYKFALKCQRANETLLSYLNNLKPHTTQSYEALKDPIVKIEVGNEIEPQIKLEAPVNRDEEPSIEFCNIKTEADYLSDKMPILLESLSQTQQGKATNSDAYLHRINTCTICDTSFKLKASLECHMWTHTGDKSTYSCTVCDSSYHHPRLLSIHMRTHTNKKSYPCTFCVKAFNSKSKLMIHTRTHTGEKPYRCAMCDSSFTQQSNLKKHMLLHFEKQYVCSVCDNSFVRKEHLTAHMRSHVVGLFACTLCEKSFSKKSNLNDHLRTHTDEKLFACAVCDMSFSKKSNLNTHMWTHTGKRPYSCSLCEKSYTQQQHLKKHMRIHTE